MGTTWFYFAAPWLLIAGVLGFVPLFLPRGKAASGSGTSGGSRALRFFVVLLGVIALACPMLRTNTPKPFLVLRDVSPSAGAQGEVSLELIDNGAGVIEYRFAENLFASGQTHESRAKPTATNLTPPLLMASSLAAENKIAAVVLLSDGKFHDTRNWTAAAKRLAETKPLAKIPLYIVPLNAPPHDTGVSNFTAARDKTNPPSCTLTVNVKSNVLCSRKLTVKRTHPSAGTIYEQQLRIFPGRPTTIRLTDSIGPQQSGAWTAQLTPTDELSPNDTAAVSVLPHESKTVGFVANSPPANREPRWQINLPKIPGYTIREVSPSSQINWNDFSAVILSGDLDALLDQSQQESLERYVRSGGGVVMLGAPSSKNAAGISSNRGTPMTRLAALVANPFERSPLAVTIILDASGSMIESFYLAADGVMSLKHHLTKHDALRVITFNSDAKTIYDSGDRPIDFTALREALSAVIPNGPTKIAAAFDAATQTQTPNKKTPLLLVLSDLRTENFRPTTITKQLRKNKWKLGIVAIGDSSDEATDYTANNIEALGNLMHSPIVRSKNLLAVGEIFGRLCDSNRESPLHRGNFKIRADNAYPNLGSMTVRTYIPSAQTRNSQLIASIGKTADPLAAWKNVALGKCFSLAAPLNLRDNPQWFAPPEEKRLHALLQKILADVTASKNDPRFNVTTISENGKLKIRVRTTTPKLRNNLKLTAECYSITPNLATSKANWRIKEPLKQTAPGTYELFLNFFNNIPADGIGIRIRHADGISRVSPIIWSGTANPTSPPEFSGISTGADFESLRKLAAATGGQIVSLDELPKLCRQTDSASFSPVWGYFLGAAILLMLTDWAAAGIITHRKNTRQTDHL
ncbi:MAG: VWA domain-containing protein [Phycisphaerae bacterium]|nr:VWA domain-containing protein [Phycisphaerae bacterium]